MKKLLLIGLFVLTPIYSYSQPLPCPPNVSSWTTTTTVATIKVCNSDGSAWISFTATTIPTNLITLTLTSCPTGFTEATEFNGLTLIGTLAANKDVGTTGGANNITPSGSISQPIFTGNAFTDVINHVHTLATGTGATGNFAQVIGTVDTTSGGTGSTPTQTTLGTRTVATVNGVASITPTGSVSAPNFSGVQFDNRSAFIKVIFCKKS